MKRQAKGGGENDAFSKFWRKHLVYMQRPGVASFYKRKARRRERHEAKRELRGEL